MILTSLINGILYVNQPYSVENIAICYDPICENRSQFTLMSNTTINDGHLAVYYISFPSNVSTYTLKLLFTNGIEVDSDALPLPGKKCDSEDKKDYMEQIFILAWFTVSSLLIIILKNVIKFSRKLMSKEILNTNE